MKTRLARTIILFTTFITLTGGAGQALAQTVIETKTDTLTTSHAQEISASGTGIVQQIAAARTAIANKKLREAKQAVWKAMALASKLKAKSPTEGLRNRIDAAAKSLEETGKLNRKKDLVPIYEQLDTAVYEHEDDIRAYLANAEKDGGKGGVDKIHGVLMDASANVEYMEVDISLDKVVQDLRRAHQALAKPGNRADAAGADALLKNADEQVSVIVSQASS